MTAVDTNILVYSTRRESRWYGPAAEVVARLAEGPAPWAVPWPCVHEFLAVVTNPRIYRPPTPLEQALQQVADWLDSPGLVLLSEQPGYLSELREAVVGSESVGGAIHDARIAALCVFHGVTTLYTADRDFSRFPRLRTHNPLLGA